MIPTYVTNLDKGTSPAHGVLGDDYNVSVIGGFYVDYNHLLLMIKLHCKAKYYETETFTTEQCEAYRKGIDDFLAFFELCGNEHLQKTLLKS